MNQASEVLKESQRMFLAIRDDTSDRQLNVEYWTSAEYDKMPKGLEKFDRFYNV